MLFGSSGYYGKDAESHSFTHKLTGLAKMAGVVAAGLVVSRPLLSAAGRGFVNQLARGEEGAFNRLSSKLIGSSTTAGEAFRNMFNQESQFIYDAAEHIERSAITFNNSMERVEDFLHGARDYVKRDSLNAFDQNRSNLVKFLSEVGRAEHGYETEETFLKSTTLKAFNQAAKKHGVEFEFANIAEQQKVFRSVLDKTVESHAGRAAVASMVNDEGNLNNILKFVDEGLKFHSHRTEATRKMFGLNKTTQHITWQQLINNEHGSRDLVERALSNMGMKPGQSGSRVDDIINLVDSKINHLFDHTIGGDPKALETAKNKFRERLLKSTTGFVRTDKGGVVSMAHLRKVKDTFLDQALERVQIPLIPYKFNIPLKSFTGFMKPTRDLVQNLGHLANNPELRRLGIRGEAHTQLIGGGGHALAITPSQEGVAKVEFVNQKFTTFKQSDSPNLRRLAQIRSLDVDSMAHTMFEMFEGGTNPNLKNALYNNQEKFLNIVYHPERGFGVVPKRMAYSPLVKQLHGSGFNIDIEKLHPTQLAEFLAHAGGTINDMNPHDYRRAMDYVLNEARQSRIDMSSTISGIWGKVRAGTLTPDIPEQYNGAYQSLLRAVGTQDVDAIREALGTVERGMPAPITEMTGSFNPLTGEPLGVNLHTHASHPFYRVINSLRSGAPDLGMKTASEGGPLTSLFNNVLGANGVSKTMERLQEGLIAETVHGLGFAKMNQLAGGEATTQFGRLFDAFERGDDSALLNNPLAHNLRGLFRTDEDLRRIVSRTVRQNASDGTLSYDHNVIAQLGTMMLTSDEIKEVSDNRVVQAKIMDTLSKNMNVLDELGPDVPNAILRQMSEDFNLTTTLHERFKLGRPFHPAEGLLNPLNTTKYYVTPDSSKSIYEFINMTVDEKKAHVAEMAGRLFGAADYVQGLTDPNKALGKYGASTQILLQMTDNIGAHLGFGLSGNDKITALRSTIAFATKRVLPLYVATEAYKNVNANLHHFGLMGLDDIGANLIANTNLTLASAKDALGLTGIAQNLVGSLPGLDQYFSPRSRDEYQDYLFYGDEAVRNGRGWLIASRSPLAGGRVDYYRPNFFRRWHGHWTEADNVDIANPYYSFLPNLQNPFAPLNRILNPNWWTNKHLSDRPYHAGGLGVGNQPFMGTGYTANTDGDYGATAIGAFGGGYATSLTGGGEAYGTGGTGGGGGRGGSGSSGGGPIRGPAGDRLHLAFHKEMPEGSIGGPSIHNTIAHYVERAREQMGIYGASLQRLPFYPHHEGAFEEQNPRQAIGLSRFLWSGDYGEATGAYGEYLRRFIPTEDQDLDAYNPLPNNQPSWMPERFKTGDPYMRVKGIGELQLAGDAYERTHPWIAPLKVRGSVLGGSEEEIMESWLHPMKPLDGPNAEDIVEFGSEAHKQIQRKLYEQGLLVSAETSIYDPVDNISGTIDAVMKGEDGRYEILDIKTQGSKSWGHTPDKYIDQITAYMAITGLKTGHLAFVNRDDMSQVRIETYNFDPNRWENILERIDRARGAMQEMVKQGKISPFETYDLLSRIEILAKTAPDSAEFREAVRFAEQSGGFGGFERQRFEQAMDQAEEMRKQYNLYPKRYGVEKETHRLTVRGVTPDGDIVTNSGVIKLAGVDWDRQAFAYEDPEKVLGQYGIKRGRSIAVTMQKGQFNPEVMADTPIEAIVGNLNTRLVRSQYASREKKPTGPLSAQVVYGDKLLGRLWERIVHSDNMITNKFMRVRTGLEQFKRGEVFGTDKARMDDILHTFIEPTFSALIHKDPVSSAIQGAVIAGMFFKNKGDRKVAAGVGAALFGSLSLVRALYEHSSGNIWAPHRYQKQTDFDEYWDTLSYIKQTAIAEEAKRKAKYQEHVDIDKLTNSGKREFAGLGPWGVLAVNAERQAKHTMYGFDVARGSLQDALAAIPRRHKQIAQEIVLHGSLKEKEQFYNLLGPAEQRVLGKFLNINAENLPDRTNMSEYFKQHFLPDDRWAGWGRDVDMTDLRTRSAELEHIQIDRPSREKLEKARAYSGNVSIPRMDHPTYTNIKRTINEIIAHGGFNGVNVDFQIHPSDHHVVNVDMDIFEDQTHQLLEKMRQQM